MASGKRRDQHVLECCAFWCTLACLLWQKALQHPSCRDGCRDPVLITSRFPETDMGEAKKAIPAISFPAQLTLTTWWFICFICFSAGLYKNLKLWGGWVSSKARKGFDEVWDPIDGNPRWNVQISWQLCDSFCCFNIAIGSPHPPFLFWDLCATHTLLGR